MPNSSLTVNSAANFNKKSPKNFAEKTMSFSKTASNSKNETTTKENLIKNEREKSPNPVNFNINFTNAKMFQEASKGTSIVSPRFSMDVSEDKKVVLKSVNH